MLHKHEWVQAEGTITKVFLRPGHVEADKFGVEVRPPKRRVLAGGCAAPAREAFQATGRR